MNLVLGAVGGYRFDQILPFVRSLRMAGRYTDDIVLLNYGIDEDTKAQLARYHVHVLWPDFQSEPNDINQQRYAAYAHFLWRNYWRYERVLLTDVRDVVFQGDPFAIDIGAGLAVFAENDVIGNDRFNCQWVNDLYGSERLAPISNKLIICSGTTMGSTQSMQLYLNRMTREVSERRGSGLWGRDQGMHNFLVYNNEIDDVKICLNGYGVYTLALVPRVNIRCNEDGTIVAPDNSIPPVVHQYDRHPDIAGIIGRKWAEVN